MFTKDFCNKKKSPNLSVYVNLLRALHRLYSYFLQHFLMLENEIMIRVNPLQQNLVLNKTFQNVQTRKRKRENYALERESVTVRVEERRLGG